MITTTLFFSAKSLFFFDDKSVNALSVTNLRAAFNARRVFCVSSSPCGVVTREHSNQKGMGALHVLL